MMNDMIWTLLVNAAVFSLLAGVMLLVRKLFARKISAVLQYALWAVVLIKLMIPFGFESTLSPLNWIAPARTAAVQPATPNEQTSPPVEFETGKKVYDPQTSIPLIQNTQTQYTLPDPTPVTTTQPSLPWEAWALMAWGAGALTTGGWLLLCRRHLRRRMRRGGADVPYNITSVFNACRQRLGNRRKIALCMHPMVQAPAITGIFRPVLMLPRHIENAGREELEHIFLHELTHSKNGDLLVITLLNLLNAIYWFNPLVWVCFKLMRKDMETICDQKVLGLLNRERQKGYVRTVLKYAGHSDGGDRLQAAMSLNDGRSRMERRIHDMFKKKKTGKGMRILITLVAVLMLASCAFTACQPTPEKPPVAGKGDGQLEKMIGGSTASAQKYEALQHWKDTAEIADLSVSIDADVSVPDTDRYPAAVIAADEITQEQADKLLTMLLKGATLYERGPDSDIPFTKEEITNEILRTKAALADPNSEANQWKKDHPENGDAKINFLKDSIAALEKAYKTAPETYEPKIVSTKFAKIIRPEMLAPIHIPEDATPEERKRLEEENKPEALQKRAEEMAQYEISGEAKLDNGKRAVIEICKTKASIHTGYGGVWDKYDQMNLPTEECKLTQEQAAETAIQTVRALGLDYLGIASVQKSYTIETDMTMSPKGKRGCYVFYLTRALNGVTANYAHANGPREEQYAPLGASECVTICISDDGIQSFEWDQPSKLLSISNESVALKPFSEIQEIFKKQILLKGAWNAYSGWDKRVIGRRITIEQARLGLMRIVRKDRPGEYLLLPVWDFYGYEANKYPEKQPGGFILDENNEHVVREFGRSYLTINAIDGSIIDRGLGY